MGEIKETLRWYQCRGEAVYFAARDTLTKFPGDTAWVLASDHDAAMAEKDREIEAGRNVARIREDYLKSMKQEIVVLDRRCKEYAVELSAKDHELNRESSVVEAQKAEIDRLKASLSESVPNKAIPTTCRECVAPFPDGWKYDGLTKATFARWACGRKMPWGGYTIVGPSASDIVDEIGERLRREERP